MKTATRPDDLEALGHLLQGDLQSKLSQVVPVQVRCLLKEGALIIVAQHPADAMPDSQETFDLLEQAILAQHRSVSKQVQMYLRVIGQNQPYGFRSFSVEPLLGATATPTPTEEMSEVDSPTMTGDSNSPETDFPHRANASATNEASPHPWDQPLPEPDSNTMSENEGQRSSTGGVTEALPSDDRAQAVGTPGASLDDLQPETAQATKTKSKRSLVPLIVAGTGLSLVVFFSTLYALTRPCVVGVCRAIPEAQELSQRSAKTLQKPQSGKAILEAQQQLIDAIGILESIPIWSSKHDKAQELIKTYQAQAERVDQMVAGLKMAARASYKSANPPHPPSTWIEVQNLWREAIAQLEQLPTNSNLQPLAQQKIKDYKRNLAQTNQRLIKERQAQGYIQVAKDAALIAQARQGVAQSLPHWQLVYATWQTALNRLKQIPQGTTAYKEAQQLSALYVPKIAMVRDRKTQEQIAANAYNQGLRLAQLAKNSQENNQWSAALIHWRNALAYINQVPSDTFYYTKAQSLVAPYTAALKQTQGQLQLAVKFQQARSDMNQTCYGKTPVCNYTIQNNVIKVRLTPAYLEMVRQVALNAKLRADSNAQAGVVNHILTLGEALEAISDNARIRVEVYAPDGSLIETHTPGN